MATRFYYEGVAAGVPTLTPAFDAAWGVTGQAVRRFLSLAADSGNSARETFAVAETTATNPVNVLAFQFISAPLAAQTISAQTLKGVIRVAEANLDADYDAQMVVRVVSNDGTSVVGTLMGAHSNALASEFNTVFQDRKFPLNEINPFTVTSVTASAGDRLVVEIGVRSYNTHTTSRNATFLIGTGAPLTTDAADVNTGGNDSDRPWMEFSGTVSMLTESSADLRASKVSVEVPVIAGNPAVRISKIMIEQVIMRDYVYVDGVLLLDDDVELGEGEVITDDTGTLPPAANLAVVKRWGRGWSKAQASAVTSALSTAATRWGRGWSRATASTVAAVDAKSTSAKRWGRGYSRSSIETTPGTVEYRRFRVGTGDLMSWWEKVLPAGAPIHADSASIIDALGGAGAAGPTYNRGDGNFHYIKFSGGADYSPANRFDVPIFRVREMGGAMTDIFIHAKDEAPDYGSGWTGFVGYIPPDLEEGNDGVRFPASSTGLWNRFDVTSGVSSDSPCIVYDTTRDYYLQFAELRYYPSTGDWYAQSVNRFYTTTYGITSGHNTSIVEPASWPATLTGTGYDPADYQDAAGNIGARGNNPMCRAVDYDRITDQQALFYAVELFAWDTAPGNVYTWPFELGENRGTALLVEGTRLRLKRSIDVDAEVETYLAGATTTRKDEVKRMLHCLQDFGCVIGDTSGSGSRIRLENTEAEGRGVLWSMRQDDLKWWNLSSSRWEVIADDYDPPIIAPYFNPLGLGG